MEHEHFHGAEKGCTVVQRRQRVLDGRAIDGAYCITHHLLICRCGQEWQWHGGVYTSHRGSAHVKEPKGAPDHLCIGGCRTLLAGHKKRCADCRRAQMREYMRTYQRKKHPDRKPHDGRTKDIKAYRAARKKWKEGLRSRAAALN